MDAKVQGQSSRSFALQWSWGGCGITYVNACLDLYGDLFARSLISIAPRAIGMVQERTVTRYLAMVPSRRKKEVAVHSVVKTET